MKIKKQIEPKILLQIFYYFLRSPSPEKCDSPARSESPCAFPPDANDDYTSTDSDDASPKRIGEILAKLDETPPKSTTETQRQISTARWTPGKERVMCALWEEEPHLYNSEHADYRNTHRRRQTLRRIAAAIDVEGIDGM